MSRRELPRQRPRARSKSQSKERGAATRVDVRALSGESGRPVAQATLELLSRRVEPRAHRARRVGDDRRGRFVLACASTRTRIGGAASFTDARARISLSISTRSYWTHPERPDEDDRVAGLHGPGDLPAAPEDPLEGRSPTRAIRAEGRFAVSPRAPLSVMLYDQNNQVVETRTVTANDFGTASGEFAIPTGRALGVWRVATSLGGADARVHVEEYKRPTFEVTLKDPAEPLRLNRPARLTGEARYYFGLPVACRERALAGHAHAAVPVVVLVARLGRGPRRPRRSPPATSALRSRRHVHARLHARRRRAARRASGKGMTYVLHGRCRRLRRGRRDAIGLAVASASASSRWRRAIGSAGRLPPRRAKESEITRHAHEPRRRAARRPRILADRPARRSPRRRCFRPTFRRILRRRPGRRRPARRRATLSVRAGRPPTIARRVLASWKDGAEIARGDVTHDAKGDGAHLRRPDCPPARTGCSTRRATSSAPNYEMPREFVVAGSREDAAGALAAVLLAEATLGSRRRDGAAPRGLGPARPADRPSRSTATAGTVERRDADGRPGVRQSSRSRSRRSTAAASASGSRSCATTSSSR